MDIHGFFRPFAFFLIYRPVDFGSNISASSSPALCPSGYTMDELIERLTSADSHGRLLWSCNKAGCCCLRFLRYGVHEGVSDALSQVPAAE